MSLEFETGVFTKSSGASAVDTVTLDGSFTPVIIILYTNGATATGGANADFQLAFGISDGTNEASTSMASQDAVSTSNSLREHRAAALAYTIIGSASGVGNITDLSAGSFDVTWVTNPSSTEYEIGYVAIGGADITDTDAGIAQHSNSTTVDATISFTPLSFEPDFMCWVEADADIVPGGGSGGAFSIGMADASGNQIALCLATQDNLGTTKTGRLQQADRCQYSMSWTKFLIRSNEFSTFTATGWDWIQRVAGNSSRKFLYFAAQTGGQLEIVTGTTNTSASTKAYSTSASPAGALLMGVNNIVSSTLDDHAYCTIGAMDGTRENSFLAADDHGIGTAECGTSHQVDAVHEVTSGAVAAGGPTIDGSAVHHSLNAADFTLNWPTNPDSVAHEFGALVAHGANGVGGGGMFKDIFDNDFV